MSSLLTTGLLGPPGGLLAGGLGGFTAPVASPHAAGRDWDVADAIADVLDATNEFSLVVAGEDPGVTGATLGADLSYVAAVDVTDWAESDDGDAGPGTTRIRTVRGTVTLLGIGQRRRAIKRALDRLGSLVQDALDGESIGGLTLPGLTECTRGKYHDDPKSGEVRLVLTWSAVMLIAGFAAHNTDE
jgi:hypothetical protein